MCRAPMAEVRFRALPLPTKLMALFSMLSEGRALVVVSNADRERELIDAASAVGLRLASPFDDAGGEEGKASGFVAQIRLLTGLQMQDRASRVVFMGEFGWTDRVQAVGRVSRPGQARPVVATTLGVTM